jgi:hypothetical protein
LVPFEKEEPYVLGRKFASNIRKLDSGTINYYRSKVEDIKLTIIDAAECGDRPPVIKDVDWLYELYYSSKKKDYRFIYNELDTWMTLNGLEGYFGSSEGSSTLVVRVNISKVNIGKSKELPDQVEVIEKILKSRKR